jgi:ribose-phosphate pyrophosphokinase
MTSRAPISAKLMANLLTTSGVDRVLTLDLHAGQIQGFFDIPVDTLYARPILVSDIRKRLPAENLIFVSPDAGGTERARSYVLNEQEVTQKSLTQILLLLTNDAPNQVLVKL